MAQAGLAFTITDDWVYESAESASPTSRVTQRWRYDSTAHQGGPNPPEITAWTTPLEDEADLLELTQGSLRSLPFATSLGKVECLKCVTALLPRPGAVWLPRLGPTKAFVAALSYKDWPDCEVGGLADYHGTCLFERVNSVDLSIDPSWVFRFQKDAAATAMEVIVIHLIVAQSLVVISFWYPLEIQQRLTDEIFAIIKSIRLLDDSPG